MPGASAARISLTACPPSSAALTLDVPKTLLEVGGAPILTHLMRSLRAIEGLSDVVIVTNDRFQGQLQAWIDDQEPLHPITLVNDGTSSNEDRLGALGDLALALERVPTGSEDAIEDWARIARAFA